MMDWLFSQANEWQAMHLNHFVVDELFKLPVHELNRTRPGRRCEEHTGQNCPAKVGLPYNPPMTPGRAKNQSVPT